MKPQSKMRYAGAFAVLLALLAVLFVWNVNSGSLHLSVREVAQILLTHSGDNAVIVWEIRLPRIFAAILLGAVCLRLSAADLFRQPDRGAVRAGYFLGG